MGKRLISIVLVIVVSFTAFISAPVSVYASSGGYSWEDYYDIDSDGNYTFNDSFYDLSTKGKVYVILDTLQNAEDKVETEYLLEETSAINTLSYICWIILANCGIIPTEIDLVNGIEFSASILTAIIEFFDNEDISVSDDGIFISSDAVNTIRETYVDDYHIVSIDDYNSFTFGSFFGYEASDYDSSTMSSYDLTYNTNMYSFFWCSDFWNDIQQSNMLFVPEIYPFDGYALLYDERYQNYNEYSAYLLQAYVPETYASNGMWHISQHCCSLSDSSLSMPGKLYYDGGDLDSDLLINRSSTTATSSSVFSFTSSYEGATLPYVAASSQMFYDGGKIISDSAKLYWVYLADDTTAGANWLNFAKNNTDYFGFSVENSDGTYTSTLKSVSSYYVDGDIYYSSYYDGSLDWNTRFVMLSKDAVLKDDVTGKIYSYNTNSDYAVSSDALDDAQDGDSTNSPSITIPNETMTYAIDNYDNIIEAVSDDDSPENVSSVIDNYIVNASTDDSDDDSSSGSSSSGSDDDSGDSGMIIEWLKKIYYKLCDFYDDAIGYLSDLKTNTVELKTYLYVMKDDLASLYSFVSGDLYELLSNIYEGFSLDLVMIYTEASLGNQYLYDLYDLLSGDLYDLLYTISSNVSSIKSYASTISSNVSSVKTYASSLVTAVGTSNGYLSDLYDAVFGDQDSVLSEIRDSLPTMQNVLNETLDLIYVDFGDLLSLIYERMNDSYLYYTGDLWELLTNMNNYVVYLYEELSAFPDTLAELFQEYFMDSYYTSQTVFEIIRGDLDLLYQMLAGDTDSVLSNMQDSIDALADAIASITSEDSEVSLSGIKGHLKVIEALLTGIAALLAVDTVVDLLDFTSEELGDYLDNITDSIGEVTDAMTDVFPFCIPWDILAILALFAAEPEAPVFEWPFDFDRLGVHYTITIDFSEYENIAMICRTILTCLFVVGLGYLTIRITGGSGGGGDED